MLSKAMAIAAAAAMAGPLPLGYVGCEYLESSHSPNQTYFTVDTANKMIFVEIDLKIIQTVGTTRGGVIGYDDTSAPRIYLYPGVNQILVNYGQTVAEGIYERKKIRAETTPNTEPPSVNLYIGKNYSGVVNFRLFGLVISEGVKPLYKMLPCIRSSDLKPGMYDTVSKQFFVNQGTGEFLFGPLSLPSGLTQSGDPYMYNGHGCVDVIVNWSGRNAIYDLVTRTITYYNE